MQTYLIVRRARRDRLARMPKVRTSEDREAERRSESLAVALFVAFVVVPLVLLFADRLADLDYGQRALMAVVEVAR
ncbi:hypothetical protein [Quisquiliibacterium transsilvanicum]|uniref:ACR3 family arsenite efflux pump ArsB n=1 Tax=Quisquiliibacterium transsilvanicum TaxID=1549638 RepID=A0A7W8M7U6_9BURK|nr:hypothetical protein [Quisquiliibacterium transsilvanicum]MBB5271361.1 ACR3 family arsenite efflux pump ArsB [Quisquiliibacterium transsilvanicum]